MKHRWIPAVFAGCVFAHALLASTPNSDVAAVIKADAVRQQSMMAGAGLEAVFSDELVFVHSDGRVEGKNEYIRNLTAGDTAYADVKTTGVQARQIAADVILLTGRQEMRKRLGSTWSEIKLLFLSVWRREHGTWRIVAWQSARPAGSSTVPPK